MVCQSCWHPAYISVPNGFCLAGHAAVCSLTLVNPGEANLTAVTVDGQPGCNFTSLAAYSSVNCTVSRQVSQADFDNWDTKQAKVVLAVMAHATALGHAEPKAVNSSTSIAQDLVSVQSLDLTQAYANPPSVTAAGKHGWLTGLQDQLHIALISI